MPKQQPQRFVDAFADRPALARRGLLPGRRVFTSLGWAVAVATVVSVTGWTMGTFLAGDDGTPETVAADVPQQPSPEPEPEPTTEEPEPEEEPEEQPEEEPEQAQEQPEQAQEQPPPPPQQQEEQPEVEDEPEPEREEEPEPETEEADTVRQENVVPDGVYRLMPGTTDDRCLDVDSSGTDAGTNVRQWECNETSAQNFALQSTGTRNTYRLIGLGGNCVDVENGSLDAGANIRMWGCNGAPAQQFRLEPNLNGYVLVSARSGHCVDVMDASVDWGANVRQWECNRTPAQTWRLELR